MNKLENFEEEFEIEFNPPYPSQEKSLKLKCFSDYRKSKEIEVFNGALGGN
jgi:hypothetical protein